MSVNGRGQAEFGALNPWKPAPTWKWDRNTTHNSRYLFPILMFVRFVPMKVNRFLAACMGAVMTIAMAKTREVVRYNILMANGGKPPQCGMRRAVLRTFQNYARYLVDFMEMGFLDRDSVRDRVRHAAGRGVFDRLSAAGGGCILVSPHLGHWELGGALLAADGYTVNVAGIGGSDAWTEGLRERVRRRIGVKIIIFGRRGSMPALESIPLVDALRKNEFVAMLPDRDGSSRSLAVDFLGGRIRISTGAAVLSWVTGAPVLPVYVVRDGAGYVAAHEPPITPDAFRNLPRDCALERITSEIARAFERIVRRHYDQWYNFFPDWVEDSGRERGPSEWTG